MVVSASIPTQPGIRGEPIVLSGAKKLLVVQYVAFGFLDEIIQAGHCWMKADCYILNFRFILDFGISISHLFDY
jgi:hypothetical protein